MLIFTKEIFSNKIFWIVTGLVIMLLFFWLLGGVGKSMDFAKKWIASEEIRISEKLKADNEKLAKAEKDAKAKEALANKKVLSKEKEIIAVKEQLKIVQGRLRDAEQRIENINIPIGIDDRAKRLRELGLKSTIVAPKPK